MARSTAKNTLPPVNLKYKGHLLAGCDEAGRGPLAGNVVAAAVILDPKNKIEGLADSKKLSEKKREALFDEIQEKALSFAIAHCNVEEIDQLNILHASMLAMKRAVETLPLQPEYVAVDGNRLPNWSYQAEAVVKGDDRVAEIAAASILAKVTRDRDLMALDKQYPAYGFAKHKGYPTKAHMQALKQFGATPEHRKSFGPVKKAISQQELFS